ncbi:MAG: acetyltransferase [Prevotella sp.]|nr:acetyltransferase [Bacteroides sp.]MCM1366400.1 acetyltransferase [Prevotella sp.]MCM1436671.1 acetyltransferase [Prevotella sp.]
MNLFGASGHAKVVMDIIVAQGDDVGYLYDDNPHCTELHGRPVIKATENDIVGPMIISIGSCQVRKLIAERYNVSYATAIHPKSIISDSVAIGIGSVVMPGAIINSDVKIGRHCIINTKSSVDHECQIGDFVHIAPGATLSGNVEVGECSWIGVGACVKQGIKIGKNCMIGAGAVVVKDIPDNSTAYGNPAIIINKNHKMQHINKLIQKRGGDKARSFHYLAA